MSSTKKFILDNSVDDGYLQDWYQTSVLNNEPIWTDKHLSELSGDLYLIPKEVVEQLK
jgi:hypothetical protein